MRHFQTSTIEEILSLFHTALNIATPDNEAVEQHCEAGSVGEIDWQRLLLTHQKAVWKVTLTPTPTDQYSIIINDLLIAHRPRRAVEYCLFEALARHYPIYCWHPETPITAMIPITTAAQLDAALRQFTFTPNAAIQQSLERQGQDPKQWLLLDTQQYNRVLTALDKNQLLKLSEVDTVARYGSYTNPDPETEDSMTETQLEQINRHYADIELARIECVEPNADMLRQATFGKKEYTYLHVTHHSLDTLLPTIEQLALVAAATLKIDLVDDYSKSFQFKLPFAANLRSLIIYCEHELTIDLSDNPQLEKFSAPSNSNTISITNPPCKLLIVNGSGLTEETWRSNPEWLIGVRTLTIEPSQMSLLQSCQHLETLIIDCGQEEGAIIPAALVPVCVKSLTIHSHSYVQIFDLHSLALQSFSLQCKDVRQSIQLPLSIQDLKLNIDCFDRIDIRHLKNLVTLDVSSETKQPLMALPNSINTLTLFRSALQRDTLMHLPDLKHVALDDLSITELNFPASIRSVMLQSCEFELLDFSLMTPDGLIEFYETISGKRSLIRWPNSVHQLIINQSDLFDTDKNASLCLPDKVTTLVIKRVWPSETLRLPKEVVECEIDQIKHLQYLVFNNDTIDSLKTLTITGCPRLHTERLPAELTANVNIHQGDILNFQQHGRRAMATMPFSDTSCELLVPNRGDEENNLHQDCSSYTNFVSLYQQGAVDAGQYRSNIYRISGGAAEPFGFRICRSGLVPISPMALPYNESTLTLLHDFSDRCPDALVGVMQTTLHPNVPQPLICTTPLQSPYSVFLYRSHENNFYVMWCQDTQQLMLQLAPGLNEIEVEIAYKIFPNNYSGTPTNLLVCDHPLLPPSLSQAVHTLVGSIAELNPLMASETPALDKMWLITRYCQEFSERATTITADDDALSTLLNQIKTKSGSCLVRSQAFVLLLNWLRVPCRLITNTIHAYPEIAWYTPGVANHYSWKAHDVLGGFERFYTHSISLNESLFYTPPNRKPSKRRHIDQQKIEIDSITVVNKALALSFLQHISPQQVENPVDLLQANNLPAPLLLLSNSQSSLSINAALFKSWCNQLNKPSERYLFIHRPEQLTDYWHTLNIENHTLQQGTGPLQKIWQEGGVVIIDWNEFSSLQKAKYMAMLEKPGLCFGVTACDQVIVISIIDENIHEQCDSFLSRTRQIKANFRNGKPPHPDSKHDGIHINCLKSSDWQRRLLAEIYTDNGFVSIVPGALTAACAQRKPLNLINPPDDTAFTQWLEQTKAERRFFLNGKWHALPEESQIHIQHQPLAMQTANLTVKKVAYPASEAVLLNANTLHRCWQQHWIDNSRQQLLIKPGLLHSHQFYCLTESVSASQWARLVEQIEYHPENSYIFEWLPSVNIIAHDTEESSPLSRITPSVSNAIRQTPYLLISNDPDEVVHQMKARMKNTLVIDISSNTTVDDIVYAITIDKSAAALTFTYHERPLLTHLKSGGTVILNGTPSKLVYQMLWPFFHSNQPNTSFYANGEFITITGEIYLVATHSALAALDVFSYQERPVARDQLTDSNDSMNKLLLLTGFASQMTQADTKSSWQFSLTHLRHMLGTLDRADHTQEKNPLKGYCQANFPRQSEKYAFLGVVTRFLFRHEFNFLSQRKLQKFHRLMQSLATQSDHALANQLWTLLNCFDGMQLEHWLGNQFLSLVTFDCGRPSLTKDKLHLLLPLLRSYFQQLRPVPTAGTEEDKLTARLLARLQTGHQPAIFLKGPPGVGKTHRIQQLRHLFRMFYSGTDATIAWLQARTEQPEPIILHLDEANLHHPHAWDFLKGLFRADRTLFFNGAFYQVTAWHKVIFSGNDDSVPGRHKAAFFYQWTETLLAKAPSRLWITEQIIMPTLNTFKINLTQSLWLANALLDVIEHLRALVPHAVISLREIQSTLQRFSLRIKDCEAAEAMAQSLFYEFALGLSRAEREMLPLLLCQRFAIPTSALAQTSNNQCLSMPGITLPPSRAALVDAIKQNLVLRQLALTSDRLQGGYKRGTLLQGNSGVGKSSLVQAILHTLGFQRQHPDPQKSIVVISAGSAGAREALMLAARAGSIVVLDEINLDPAMESLLNPILEGQWPRDFQSCGEVHPGFYLFASQNPAHYPGRFALSPALATRLHALQFDDYTSEELVAVTRSMGFSDAEQRVAVFQQPTKSNPRLFFQWLKHDSASSEIPWQSKGLS